MPTAPAAPMPGKLFITRTAEPFRDLFERRWDGEEWIWVDHGRPGGIAVVTAPGAAMGDDKLFVGIDDGRLYERVWNGTAWVWNDHGAPPGTTVARDAAPGAAMENTRFFVVGADGRLFERAWGGAAWEWSDHGLPPGTRCVHAPESAVAGTVWVAAENGGLLERTRGAGGAWAWTDHGCPPGTRIGFAPLASGADKVFVSADDGRLFERSREPGGWVWVDHGRPPRTDVGTAPGALRPGKFWVGARDGRMFERLWTGTAWTWADHGRPPGTDVSTAPGAAVPNKLFIGTRNERMFERLWTGTEWKWVDHGTLRQDEATRIVDPGPRPGARFNVAVVGDGWTEADLDRYRNHVRGLFDDLFRQDIFAEFRRAFTVTRIDLVSYDSGVWERSWDLHGTPNDPADDTLSSEQFRFTRLGYVNTGQRPRLWIEEQDWSERRLRHVVGRFVPGADAIVVILNAGGWGGLAGGGVIRVTAGEGWATLAHELGHRFGVADEYTLRGNVYTGPPFIEHNCSSSPARADLPVPWRNLVDAATPLPTDPVPRGWDDATDVGAFEGACTFERGVFRPTRRCRMINNTPEFCPVCEGVVRDFLGPHL